MRKYPLHRTCREAAALILAREDRALPWPERMALRLHFVVCRACPNFAQEVALMRGAFAAWRRYAESDGE